MWSAPLRKFAAKTCAPECGHDAGLIDVEVEHPSIEGPSLSTLLAAAANDAATPIQPRRMLMMEHDVLEFEAEAWLRRARRLRKAAAVDAAERRNLIALAEDCEMIARRTIARRAGATAKDGTPVERDDA
jgi:hypothetical protein